MRQKIGRRCGSKKSGLEGFVYVRNEFRIKIQNGVLLLFTNSFPTETQPSRPLGKNETAEFLTQRLSHDKTKVTIMITLSYNNRRQI